MKVMVVIGHMGKHTQMSKTIGKLEKEMLMWKSRYEKCNKSLLEMAEEVCSLL